MYDKEGYKLLNDVSKVKKTEDLQKMLFIFSIVLDFPDQAMKHFDELYAINKKAGENLLMKFF